MTSKRYIEKLLRKEKFKTMSLEKRLKQLLHHANQRITNLQEGELMKRELLDFQKELGVVAKEIRAKHRIARDKWNKNNNGMAFAEAEALDWVLGLLVEKKEETTTHEN